MKIYFANMFGVKGLERYLRHKIDILAAFPSFKNGKIKQPVYCDDLFVDSGAFGKQSKKVILDDYIQFIKKNESQISVYANFDVIGDAEATWKNQKMMEREGLKPLPVFHYSNDIKWLYRLINKYNYIALGGAVPIAGDQKAMFNWLDSIWKIILSESPKLKIHGFGIQNIKIAKRYPWYSIDSSSVHIMARYGGIYSPWGSIKINPNIQTPFMKWQIKKPSALRNVYEFVEQHIDNVPFELTRKTTPEATLMRCAISIHYLTDILTRGDSSLKDIKRGFF